MRIIKNIILGSLCIGMSLFATVSENSILSAAAVKQTEATILKQAEATKNYTSIGTIGLAFIKTANSPTYSGNSSKLLKLGQKLVHQSIQHYEPSITLIVGLKLAHINYPAALSMFSRLVKHSINDPKLASVPIMANIRRVYATLLLQDKTTHKNQINTAIKSLVLVNKKQPADYFFLAQLFRRLGDEKIANSYLNFLCMHVKSGKFYSYCHSAQVTYIQPLKNKLIHPWCHGDPTQQCH